MKYKVLRYDTKIGEEVYSVGDIVEHFDEYPWDQAIRNGAVAIFEPGNSEKPKVKQTNVTEKKATITKGGPWYKVLDSDGNLIGKATRDEEEAKFIKEDYESN